MARVIRQSISSLGIVERRRRPLPARRPRRPQQPLLEVECDLAEDLLLRVEVAVEGAVGDAGAGDDVVDVGVEVPLLGEHLGGGRDQLGPGPPATRR